MLNDHRQRDSAFCSWKVGWFAGGLCISMQGCTIIIQVQLASLLCDFPDSFFTVSVGGFHIWRLRWVGCLKKTRQEEWGCIILYVTKGRGPKNQKTFADVPVSLLLQPTSGSKPFRWFCFSDFPIDGCIYYLHRELRFFNATLVPYRIKLLDDRYRREWNRSFRSCDRFKLSQEIIFYSKPF